MKINSLTVPYLTNYRLKKSIELLELCFEVGFSGASYFTETFHKTYGCKPTEYRLKRHQRGLVTN